MGGNYFNEDRTKPLNNTPEGEAALQFWVNFVEKGIVPKEGMDSGVPNLNAYTAGKIALYPGWPQDMLNTKLNAPQIWEDTLVGPPLKQKEQKFQLFVDKYMIYKRTKAADESFKLVKALVSGDAGIKLRHRGHLGPAGAQGAREGADLQRSAHEDLPQQHPVRQATPGRAAALRRPADDGPLGRGGRQGRQDGQGGAERDGRRRDEDPPGRVIGHERGNLVDRRRAGHSGRPELLRLPAARRLPFILPSLLFLAIFVVYPILSAFWLSLHRYTLLEPPVWNGLTNYRLLLEDARFVKALGNTFLFALMTVPVGTVISLLLAVLINRALRGIVFFRTAYYLPVVTSFVAVSFIWLWIYEPQFGMLNQFSARSGCRRPPGCATPARRCCRSRCCRSGRTPAST